MLLNPVPAGNFSIGITSPAQQHTDPSTASRTQGGKLAWEPRV